MRACEQAANGIGNRGRSTRALALLRISLTYVAYTVFLERRGGGGGHLLGSPPEDDGRRARLGAAGEEVPALVAELRLFELGAVPQDPRGDAVDGRLHLSSGGLLKNKQTKNICNMIYTVIS